MKPIIFCHIAYMSAYMSDYRGGNNSDKPVNGGEYVKETGDAHEKNNFLPSKSIFWDDENDYCYGFIERRDKKNSECPIQTRIEEIYGCEGFKNKEKVDDVLVVWCAHSSEVKHLCVVGWYNHATVLRNMDGYCDIEDTYGNKRGQDFNFYAKTEDCILLPENERKLDRWSVPISKENKYHFGFALQSQTWYGKITKYTQNTLSKSELELCQTKLNDYLENLIENIENYDGNNEMDIKIEDYDIKKMSENMRRIEWWRQRNMENAPKSWYKK